MQVNVTSDINRTLTQLPFIEGATLSLNIPRDSVFKYLQIRLVGAVQTTFASGTPVADNQSTMSNLINFIDIIANGSFNIKNVTPWMMHVQSLLATGDFGVRKASAAAAAASPAENVTADSKFVYGTTTQYTSVVESILIPFENSLAGRGRMKTMWDTRGLASAEMKVSTGAFSSLLGYGNTAPVAFANSTFVIQTGTIELQNVPQNAYFSAYKQTTKAVGFTAQTTDFALDINRGNYLQGLMFEAHDGAAGSATTATGRVLSDTLLTNIKLVINGSLYLQNTLFNSLQDMNRNRFGLNAPFANNVSLMTGMAYMDLLTPAGGEKFGDLDTAQNVQSPQVDTLQTFLSTASGATYTATASVKVMTSEIVPPVVAA